MLIERHVTWAAPAVEVAGFVFVEAGEAATGDDGFDALVEYSGEQCVVAAQGVADAADAVGVDFGKRLQQVDRADVVVDRLHRTAHVIVGVEIVLILAERRIVGRQRDVAALSKFGGVVHRRSIG